MGHSRYLVNGSTPMVNEWIADFMPWQWWMLLNIASGSVALCCCLYMLFNFLDPNDKRMGRIGSVFAIRFAIATIIMGCMADIVDNSISYITDILPAKQTAREILLNFGFAILLSWVVWFHETQIKRHRAKI